MYLGDYENDLTGCDTLLNAGYVYDNGRDNIYGNSPALIIDVINGPQSFIPAETYIDINGNNQFDFSVDTPLDSAFLFSGWQIPAQFILGAKNLGMTSFNPLFQYSIEVDLNNEVHWWNHLRGMEHYDGYFHDPCKYHGGTVIGGVDCSSVNPLFVFSGDPVANAGWINTYKTDQRVYVNTGPFTLSANETVEIIGAYVLGRAEESLLSVNEVKRTDRIVQTIFDKNFIKPEIDLEIEVNVIRNENSIELIWDASEFINFAEQLTTDDGGSVYDMRFEGFEVFMFRTASTAEYVNGELNKIKIASFDLENDYGDIIIENLRTGERSVKFKKGIQLNREELANHDYYRIVHKIEIDPFTNNNLIKGKPYYISISAYALNIPFLEKLYPQKANTDIYLISNKAFWGFLETPQKIICGSTGVVPGDDANRSFAKGIELEHITGGSSAKLYYSILAQEELKPDDYLVTFERDSFAAKYKITWSLVNSNTNEILIHNSDQYNSEFPVNYAEGIGLNIEWIEPVQPSGALTETENWLKAPSKYTGAVYVGYDIDSVIHAEIVNIKESYAISANDMRRVELRFGKNSNAYRYYRANLSTRYLYPNQNDPTYGPGVIEVPFQAWVKDYQYGEEYQLAIGYTETFYRGVVDNQWTLSENFYETGEYIVVFNTPYKSECNDVVYTGTFTGSAAQKYADVGNGYRIDINNPNYSITDSMVAIAKSPWFSAMYVVALEKSDTASSFIPTGTYVITPSYPLTEKDTFTFTPKSDLTLSEKKTLFDKVSVYPNPFWGYNKLSNSGGPSEQFITFSDLPEKVTIKIYSLAGNLVRTLGEQDKSFGASPFIKWDLRNENNYIVGSGIYLAVVSSPGIGEKVLKFSVILGRSYKQVF
ncbi:MAG: hypothetical protein KKG93_14360 [Bacteroidetes bacterium]|nr:hypothetical protein [Bacteroidota bacterium]